MKKTTNAPPVHQSQSTQRVGGQAEMILVIIATVIITTVVVSGGMYVWHTKTIRHALETHNQKFEKDIQVLKDQIQSLDQRIKNSSL